MVGIIYSFNKLFEQKHLANKNLRLYFWITAQIAQIA